MASTTIRAAWRQTGFEYENRNMTTYLSIREDRQDTKKGIGSANSSLGRKKFESRALHASVVDPENRQVFLA
jgi:hypothetical protein